METVFDALKAMGKATSIELAARLDISREEVLNELWELKKAGFVDKSAYTWRVADNNVQQEQPMQAELPEETTTATVVKISECDLTATIEQRGSQTADELATLFGTTSRKVASTLAMAISKGRLIRVNQNGKFRYCMPGDNLPAEPKAASVAETDGKAFPQPAGVALPVQEAATQEEREKIKEQVVELVRQSGRETLRQLEAKTGATRYLMSILARELVASGDVYNSGYGLFPSEQARKDWKNARKKLSRAKVKKTVVVDPDLIWSLPDGEIRRYDRRQNIICRECRKSEVMKRVLAFYQGNLRYL